MRHVVLLFGIGNYWGGKDAVTEFCVTRGHDNLAAAWREGKECFMGTCNSEKKDKRGSYSKGFNVCKVV